MIPLIEKCEYLKSPNGDFGVHIHSLRIFGKVTRMLYEHHYRLYVIPKSLWFKFYEVQTHEQAMALIRHEEAMALMRKGISNV